ncbi:DUF6022 family protein [Paenibacillus sp. FSL W7-1279]|uniref:DUF6022 family protein n=1 Tax=Paenibacillus sp. FSL W7-1279 TaxID=2921697 RepID=UPI0030D87265
MVLTACLNESMMKALAHYCQGYMNDQWLNVWEQNLNELEGIFQNKGDYAYGLFCSKLFRPLEAEVYGAGLTPKPVMPGAFPQSEELWGPWEERERRFWSVIHYDNGRALGTLITRFFHDHTAFRIPTVPRVYAIPQTELAAIKEVISHMQPEEWGSISWEDERYA